MNQQTKQAITAGHPMYWERSDYHPDGTIVLVAVTYTYDSGAVRTKKLTRTWSYTNARDLSDEIVAAGGTVDTSLLSILEDEWNERRDRRV